ncbi:uveal autoantigen with coiled-coil domains and ankyrin repeats-like [Bolinopsis microptera]|uniref:uveal autoantigen with coiled-coil domains and ankyrin repeats-like n=1 Tax=Bolinopsis microptera TaxID=2820187 RepID=UPI003079771F
MIKDLRVKDVSWFGGILKWDYTECEGNSVTLLERAGDSSKTVIHYRGRKRQCKIVGLNPNTNYTFTLQLDERRNLSLHNTRKSSDSSHHNEHLSSTTSLLKPDIPEIKVDDYENQKEGESEQKMENLINDDAVKPTESSSEDGKHDIESGQNGNGDEQNDTEDADKQLDLHYASPPTSPEQTIPENEPELLVTDNEKSAVEYAPTSPTTVELEVTFRTEKCGKHDARLISAIENHDMGEVVRICSQSPEVISIPDKTGVTPLMIAAVRGYPSIIRILLEAGANLDQLNPGGKTALMLAAYHGHSHVITTLMELGCDWQRLDNAGCTALHYCVERGNIDIAQTLIDSGADINMPDSRGYTCLLSLCINDSEDVRMAKFLLDNGADPNLNLQRGETMLMAAARSNKPGLARVLIEYGANVKTKTRYGYTALDMARPASECYDVISECPLEETDSENEDDDLSSWLSDSER